MEVSNITMTGLGRAMSDLDAKDGELSVSHNIINDNGAMRPIWVPEDVMTLQNNEELVYVHRTADYKNYIVSGREVKRNHISIYYMHDKPLYFVFQYPTASELTIEIGYVLEAGEQWTSFTFPEGTYGKQERQVDGVLGTVTDLKFEHEDEYFVYNASYVYNDENQIENATWEEEMPEFAYGLHFFTDEDTERKPIVGSLLDDSMKLSSIGNTLVVTSDRGLEYILYKDGSYKYLGQKPPELNVSWRMSLRRSSNGNSANCPLIEITGNTGTTSIDEEYQSETGVKVAAEINRMLANDEENNRFTSTFFVRWAYRMYNGLYMASPPVMMPLNLGISPAITILDENGNTFSPDSTLTAFRLKVDYFNADLEYLIPYYNTRVKPKLDEWSDIIDGVEIYVTRGISRYDQDGKAEGVEVNNYDERCISYGSIPSVGVGGGAYSRRWLQDGNAYRLKGMLKEESEYFNELTSEGIFYRIRSYKLDELSGGNVVELEDSALKNLTTSSVLSKETDEYLEHDILYPEGLHVYNGRLNLYGVKSEKYNFPVHALTIFTNGYSGSVNDNTFMDYFYNIRFIIGGEGESVSTTDVETLYKLYEPPLYLFYPDNNAKRAIIERVNPTSGGFDQLEVVLSSHPTLQGCYWFGGINPPNFKAGVEGSRLEEESPEERRVNNSGKIYTSEVNNPFIFPLGGINTIGTGRVVGISTVTKALSQGQFGQFPLYVFSTEGVWAMEVGSNGLYSSIKPVSRDVCINGESITQTDDAVLFVTEQGVMYLDGSNVVSISDMMNGRSLDVESIYGLGGLMKDGLSEAVDFVEYARTARMAYDYANSRILLYREDMKHCYVFSMTTKVWATLGMEIENAVTDYPDVYVQKGSGVKNLSTRVDYDSKDKVSTLIVTRPLKFGDDGFKTVYETVARGAMDRREGAVLLWGSHDGMEYVLIKAVRGNRIYRTCGSGYRYFRIGVVGDMNPGETLSVISVGLRRKYQNRLR